MAHYFPLRELHPSQRAISLEKKQMDPVEQVSVLANAVRRVIDMHDEDVQHSLETPGTEIEILEDALTQAGIER